MKRIYKEKKGDKVWWVDTGRAIGEFVFTLDKKKYYNLFADYPEKLSVQDWITFNEENEYWVDFFKDQNEDYMMDHVEELKKLGREDLIKKMTGGK